MAKKKKVRSMGLKKGMAGQAKRNMLIKRLRTAQAGQKKADAEYQRRVAPFEKRGDWRGSGFVTMRIQHQKIAADKKVAAARAALEASKKKRSK
jgi:hypothetical protein